MDEQRFDALARAVARPGTRRRFLGGALGAGVLALLGGRGAGARRGTAAIGDPCWHDAQCFAADTAVVCGWNGFGYDGDYTCCAVDGGRCSDDPDCCGYDICAGGFCTQPNYGASAGNGGIANADASGGSISVGNINSGGNRGNTISVGNSGGPVSVSGGTVTNDTSLNLSADGGTAISDASGGSGNIAISGGDSGGGIPGGGSDAWAACPNDGCQCWQRGNDDNNPCGGGLVCCRSGGGDGICLTGYTCAGYGSAGDFCPSWCDAGSGCGSCYSGWCNWGGYCA